MTIKTMKHTISWSGLNGDDEAYIKAIALRAQRDLKLNRLDTLMDVTATHLNGCPLRLEELLEADAFNFVHDIIGIRNNLNRDTGKMENCFLPRFYTSKTAKSTQEVK